MLREITKCLKNMRDALTRGDDERALFWAHRYLRAFRKRSGLE